ncbi:hypothetical protein [Noviherbaspirillum sp.]|uniref:hypothetical protein n=1 Tax=Noviherbaspirillum sp. TaxID=1926288 RepID=UPI002D50168B|nr:hypothetical protein [Noviherbaspirillum sp.]HZW21571.1 hypothetical protein [Noviherbaspirillum sp.]
MNLWLVNPPWQNFSSMYRESVSAAEAVSEVEERHHKTAALYFGIAALEAFLNQKMRTFLSPKMTEQEVLKELRYAKFMDKISKWPAKIIGCAPLLSVSLIDRIEEFNDVRAGLTHAKTRGHDVYSVLEALKPSDVVESIAEFIVKYHEAEATRFPYWVFGWNYLNPQIGGHEIILIHDQQFVFSLRALGAAQIPGGYGWEEQWKDKTLKSYDGYVGLRDFLLSRSACEPKYANFPLQPKLCRRWWEPEHQRSCGACPQSR